jgi:hypothetical protein
LIMLVDILRYELPPGGTTLLGYVVRRMHKTGELARVPALLAEGKSISALKSVAVYAAASSTSFGRAYYQPRFDVPGAIVEEPDPATGARVTARLESTSPHYRISYQAVMSNGDLFSGSEEITGTTVGLRGLGMPAPSKFTFSSGNYRAQLTGILTSELALSLFGVTRIRAHGWLKLDDSAGNTGRLELQRSGDLSVVINGDPVANVSLLQLVRRHAPSSFPAKE